MKYYKYKIYCITEQKWEYWILDENAAAPTTCPTSSTHQVNLDSVSIEDTIDQQVIQTTVAPEEKTASGMMKVSVYEPEGDAATIVSHNFSDKCSWYQGAIQIISGQLSTTDNLTYADPNGKTHWIDLENARLYDEDNILAKYPKYKVKIYVDGTLKTAGTDYNVDYPAGTITFLSSQSGVVTADYHYADKGWYIIKPSLNKKISIRTTEVQFSADTQLSSPFVFEPWFHNHPTYGTMPIPGRRITYKNAKDFISACNEGQGYIRKWGELQQDTIVFPFQYARPKPIRYSEFVEIRVYPKSHAPCTGEYSTATFYITIEDEVASSSQSGGTDMGIQVIHGTYTFTKEYAHNETLELIGIPANARIKCIKLRPKAPGYAWYWEHPQNGPMSTMAEFYIGTIAHPDVFTNDDLSGNPFYASSANSLTEYANWYKEAQSTQILLTFVDRHNYAEEPTIGLTGQTLEYWIEYIQE